MTQRSTRHVRFLQNRELWRFVTARAKRAKRVRAAVAYLGAGGAALLPLRRGHRIVVDLSLPTVKAGTSDPREVEKLQKRGVLVFTRRNLHAKVFVIDNAVIAGSANVSHHSKVALDEAAIVTTDLSVVRRALAFIDSLCTEPVRPEYLALCKRVYRPPRVTHLSRRQKGQVPRSPAKLWVVRLADYDVPDSERARYEEGERKAASMIRDARSKTDSFHWPSKPRMADELRSGDWVLCVTTYSDGAALVAPPSQLLLIDSYRRARGKRRYVFHYETPARGQSIPWQRFRRALAASERGTVFKEARTFPVRNSDLADKVMRLWTTAGRFAPSSGAV